MPEINVQDEQGNIHVFPDGSTPQQIAQALGVKPPASVVPQQTLDTARANIAKYPENQASIGAAPKPFTMPWLKSKFYTAADAASEGLPAAGATAGALIGGGAGTAAPGPGNALGAVGGAGIGGMAGDAAKQLVRRWLGFEDAPQTPPDAANEIAKQGLVQGGIEAASAGLARFAPWLRNAANAQYERALAPTTKVNKAIAEDITPQMIKRGIHGNLEGIEQQAGQQAGNLRPQLDAAYQAMPQSSTARSGPQVIQSLENLKSKYIVNGMPANPQAVNAISGVQDIVRQYGNDIDPNSLRQLKQIFDEPVAARGGYAGADLTTQYTVKAQKAAGNSIRNILHQASPDVAALDKEISFWLDVQRVAGASALRRTGQEGLIRGLGLPFLGFVSGGAVGHVAAGGGAHTLEGAAGAALSVAAAQAIKSPAWRTASAVFKDRFADALASGNVGQVAGLAGRLGVAIQGYQPAGSPANRSEQPQ